MVLGSYDSTAGPGTACKQWSAPAISKKDRFHPMGQLSCVVCPSASTTMCPTRWSFPTCDVGKQRVALPSSEDTRQKLVWPTHSLMQAPSKVPSLAERSAQLGHDSLHTRSQCRNSPKQLENFFCAHMFEVPNSCPPYISENPELGCSWPTLMEEKSTWDFCGYQYMLHFTMLCIFNLTVFLSSV